MAPGGIMPGCMGMGTMPGWPGMGRTMKAMGCPGPPPGMPGIIGIICTAGKFGTGSPVTDAGTGKESSSQRNDASGIDFDNG